MSKSEIHQESPSEKLASLRLELIDLIDFDKEKQLKPLWSEKTIKSQDRIENVVEFDTVSLARTLLKGWFQNNLGQAMFDLAEQNLKSYSKKSPFLLVGMSLTLGATLVLIKPWKLLPKSLPATLGSIIVVKIYKSLMMIILKKH